MSFECELCQKVFSERYNLKRHMIIHTGEKPYACTECDKKYKYKYYLKFHLRAVHSKIDTEDSNSNSSTKVLQCEICQRVCEDKNKLQRHKRSHTGEKPYACSECDKSFADRSYLEYHIKSVHCMEEPDDSDGDSSKKLLRCELCGKAAPSRAFYIRHMRKHTGEKPYACSECDKRFYDKAYLKFHIQTKHCKDEDNDFNCSFGKTPPKCEICQKLFMSKVRLERHMTLHTGERPHACNECDKSFTDKYYLEYHIRTVHLKEEFEDYECLAGNKLFRCNFCEKKFPSRSKVKKHLMTHIVKETGTSTTNSSKYDKNDEVFIKKEPKEIDHLLSTNRNESNTGEENHTCIECNKNFSAKSYLNFHIKQVHFKTKRTLLKKFHCLICKNNFTTKNHLERHKLTHSKSKAFSCNLCGMNFNDELQHNKHYLNHNDDKKPHVCKICFKSFAKKYYLDNHMTIHNKDKPFECGICKMAFRSMKYFHNHAKIHIADKTHFCDFCNKGFHRKNDLKRHFKIHASILSEEKPMDFC